MWVVIVAKVLQEKARNLRHQVGEATVVQLCLRAALSSDRARNTLESHVTSCLRASYPAFNRTPLMWPCSLPCLRFSLRILVQLKTFDYAKFVFCLATFRNAKTRSNTLLLVAACVTSRCLSRTMKQEN